MAAPVSIHGSRESAMSEELSRFWSSVGRRFESERSAGLMPFGGSRTNDTWDDLVGPSEQVPVAPTQYLKEEEGDEVVGGWEEAHEEEVESVRVDSSPVRSAGVLSDDNQVLLDGARIGDVPARYVVQGLRGHEKPVVGTYVDPSIVPGFCYQVRPLDTSRMLFQGAALRLVSIGMGYGKRITFASESASHNDNYFWSDTHPDGCGFSIKLVAEGDAFTLQDANGTPVATGEVLALLGPQQEVSHRVMPCGGVEKRARVAMLCRVYDFEEGPGAGQLRAISGVAVAVKAKGNRAVATTTKVVDCSGGGERGYTLVAGVDVTSTITHVSGEKIGDIPTKYTVTGLQAHEQPVVGTYVDPRIATGFRYRVRPLDSKKMMFQGAALTLQSIGRGYGKRLTFASDSHCHNENYFWSDTHPEGCGFSLVAVAPGDTFRILEGTEEVGRAQVFRSDVPQVEVGSSVGSDGCLTKRVHVSITCDVTFHGEDDRTLPVTGTAVVERRGRVARTVRVEDVALGSQINVLFTHRSSKLVFVRE